MSRVILMVIVLALAVIGISGPRARHWMTHPGNPGLKRVGSAPFVMGLVPDWEQKDIASSWQFRTDPDDSGLQAGWANLEFDDSAWWRIDTGDYWENQGFPGYDGVAWYRRWVDIPQTWQGKRIYLWVAGADDEYDVFTNGKRLAHYGDRSNFRGAWHDKTATDVTSSVLFGSRNLFALRVNDWHELGGVSDLPLIISTSDSVPLSTRDYLKEIVTATPGVRWGIWPSWLRDEDSAWTMTGVDDGNSEAIVALDGTMSPWNNSFSLELWVYDERQKRLVTGRDGFPALQLSEGYLPIVKNTWKAGDLGTDTLQVVTTTFAFPPGGTKSSAQEVVVWRATVTNLGADEFRGSIVVAIRPFAAAGAFSPIYRLSWRDSAVQVNGELAVFPETVPSAFAVSPLIEGDVGAYLTLGALPGRTISEDAQGLISGAMVFSVSVEPGQTRTLSFLMPSPSANPDVTWDHLGPMNLDLLERQVRDYWAKRLSAVQVSLPDPRYSEAFLASQAYLLIGRDSGQVVPGPLRHNLVWVRDTVYMIDALLKTGHTEAAQLALRKVLSAQLPSGAFPPIISPDGTPAFFERREWDAQGQMMYAIHQVLRLSDGEALERDVVEVIMAVARYIKRLTGETAGGILPPGESAEDLGSASWHHYWDDFWTISGLRYGARVAEYFQRTAVAEELQAQARELEGNLRQSIRVTMERTGTNHIPNGPEDVESSAAARGATPALWPPGAFRPSDPLVRGSFEDYYIRWFDRGAFRHTWGHVWPYAGLGLAHAYLLLGDTQKVREILEWTLLHQTASPTYAWAESVDPLTGLFRGGDMPHGWVAAEYILLIRDMLVREDEERIILGDFLYPEWLADGNRIIVRDLPTYWGRVSYTITSRLAEGEIEVAIAGTAAPPDGYLFRWRGPQPIESAVSEAGVPVAFDSSGLRLPPGRDKVIMRLGVHSDEIE